MGVVNKLVGMITSPSLHFLITWQLCIRQYNFKMFIIYISNKAQILFKFDIIAFVEIR